MKPFIILAMVLTPAYTQAACDWSLQFEPTKTDVQFTLHDVLHTVHGSFKLKRGSIHFDPDSGKASGEIVVDVASGASGSDARDHRMHKEVLESQRYPEATFIPDHVNGKFLAQLTSQVDVHGMLRIHGADHELTLHFEVQPGEQFTATTHFTIPYVDWGMKNPSNFVLKVDKTLDMDIKTTTAKRVLVCND
jgi:polyisoprenoid-binding protein YceI